MNAAKVEKARQLRETGLSYPNIAAKLGVSKATVRRALRPERAARDRALARAYKARNREALRAYDARRAREHRGTCTTCGGFMGIGNAEDGTCRGCVSRQHHAVGEKLVRLWGEGKLYPEIMAEMGWTKDHLNVALHTYRAEGFDLPYRYGDERIAAVRAGVRRAA